MGPVVPVQDREDGGVVRRVDLAGRFHGAEDVGDGGGDRGGAAPPGEVLEFPGGLRGEVVVLPGKGEAGVDVGGEEGVD